MDCCVPFQKFEHEHESRSELNSRNTTATYGMLHPQFNTTLLYQFSECMKLKKLQSLSHVCARIITGEQCQNSGYFASLLKTEKQNQPTAMTVGVSSGEPYEN